MPVYDGHRECKDYRSQTQYPVKSPDRLCGLSALFTSSVDVEVAAGAVTSRTCGSGNPSGLPPDEDGLTSRTVRLGFSISEVHSSTLGTACAS